MFYKRLWLLFGIAGLATAVCLLNLQPQPVIYAGGGCTRQFLSVSEPLNDLGAAEYVRMDGTPTGFSGGLYPDGLNTRPSAHDTAGQAIADQIVPLNVNGNPAANGRIVLIAIGMSNPFSEFRQFIIQADTDPELHPLLALVNGAQPGQVSPIWADPNNPVWDVAEQRLAAGGLTPQQVQVAWVKLTQMGGGDFPTKAEAIQADLEVVGRNLKIHYPNIKLAYFSSRTRGYDYIADGMPPDLSPEPVAFESGFAVKWLLEKQINGDSALNYDPDNGPVVAPWLSWGPYLWIDGLNLRSDGRTWPQENLAPDCTHPNVSGEQEVAEMLLDFFKTDSTTAPWFLADGAAAPIHFIYLPILQRQE